ncbi:MAG: 3-oxoacyl-[acyl-carrier-protein] reductase [bacterium]|nr:3-oxoacyl-[acyl-carrier-protein] reductase [bacterium]
MFDLSGQKALVTGASGGIGSAIATALHAQGATVALSGTRTDALERLAFKLGSRCHVLACNLNDREEVEGLVQRAEDALGQVDILVNNAGITRDTLMARMKNEDWDSVLNINLTSAFLLTRASLKAMMRRRSGRIINISSIVGVTGNPGQTNYCASKAGIIGLSKSLAQEVASRGITVNCVAPGFIRSAMTDQLNEDQSKVICAKIPTGKIGSPEDIAAACVYLSSKESQYMTGQTLHVNGGMAMI